MRIGLIGNHSGLARSLTDAGLEIVSHRADTTGNDGLGHPSVTQVERYDAFFDLLEHPRLFLLDLPLGAAVDRAIDAAYVFMEPGDVVLDPSGSYWCDTLRRFRRMRHRSLFYVDLGLIGTIPGATILAAGDERGVDLCVPLLDRLAAAGGVVRAGGAGAAHFALMVRAGVATAMTHAVSEAQAAARGLPERGRGRGGGGTALASGGAAGTQRRLAAGRRHPPRGRGAAAGAEHHAGVGRRARRPSLGRGGAPRRRLHPPRRLL